MSRLRIENIFKSFGETHALDGVSFELADGEIIAVLGPSGCGKSTLLSIIAGLEQPDAGMVSWQGKDLAEVPTHQRGFGLMFQDYALFPHMLVSENIAFGLKMAGAAKPVQQRRTLEVLDLVGLPGFGYRQVTELSGGEQQRVALARAVVNQPSLLLLDEPLGSLDRGLREQLMEDLRSILRNTEQTTLYVTHDQEEAFSLADRVAVMRQGRIAQLGTPQEIFCQPNSVFVARFVGLNNIFPGEAEYGFVTTAVGKFPVPREVEGSVDVLLRPDQANLIGDKDGHLIGRVEEVIFRGKVSRISVMVNDHSLQFDFSSGVDLPKIGDQVSLGFARTGGIQIFPRKA